MLWKFLRDECKALWIRRRIDAAVRLSKEMRDAIPPCKQGYKRLERCVVRPRTQHREMRMAGFRAAELAGEKTAAQVKPARRKFRWDGQ
jgi:hypothetical protein